MNPENILKTGSKIGKFLSGRTARSKINSLKAAVCPTKIFYLWEKHGIKRIELLAWNKRQRSCAVAGIFPAAAFGSWIPG